VCVCAVNNAQPYKLPLFCMEC